MNRPLFQNPKRYLLRWAKCSGVLALLLLIVTISIAAPGFNPAVVVLTAALFAVLFSIPEGHHP